jgi:superfamily II DNA or RNA helicase
MFTLKIDHRASVSPLEAQPHRRLVDQIARRLTFENPRWAENEKRGFSNFDMPEYICGYELSSDRLIVPRGFTMQLVGILRSAGVQFTIADRRRTLALVDFTFTGQLKDFQVQAVDAMAARDFGVLAAPTGSGKTIMALALVARRQQPAMVVVHTRELMEQWIIRIENFLGIPAGQVKRIGGGKQIIGGKIGVASVQSLYKVAHDIAPHIGHLVVDECHRPPSMTFTESVSVFECGYMTGLSTAPWRRDGLSRLIYWHLGDKVYEVNTVVLVEAGHVLQAVVTWRSTSFEPTYDPSTEYSRMLSELTRDASRNALIAADVAQETRRRRAGRVPGTF